MAAASHVGCASAIIRDCTVMNCDHMRRDCTVILLLGSCIVEIGSVVACHDAVRDEKSTKNSQKQLFPAVLAVYMYISDAILMTCETCAACCWGVSSRRS